MSLFIGTSGNDTITPGSVSRGVIVSGTPSQPSNAADTIIGGLGDDIVAGGGGSDRFIWSAGDGADTVDGGEGTDVFQLNGTDGAFELISLAAADGQALATLGQGTVTLDNVERIEVNAAGGTDWVVIGDLSSAGVTEVVVELAATINGSVDGQSDAVFVEGRQSAENVTVAVNNNEVIVSGAAQTVRLKHAESADNLVVNGGGGDDVISAAALPASAILLSLNGGAGDDTLIGGAGADSLFGGDGDDSIDGNQGNDIVKLGAGDDTFSWNAGDGSDKVDGEAGFDTFSFTTSSAQEIITISANGARTRLSRDVTSVTLDIGGVERIDVKTLAGADTLIVNDLSGSGTTQVNIDLGVNGTGDNGADTVIVNATTGDDTITLTSGSGETIVGGLAAETRVTGAENVDIIRVDGGAGSDTMTGGAGADSLHGGDGNDVIDGKQGNDTLSGGAGADWLYGGDGNDVIDGDQGNDTVDLGAGDDTFLWTPGEDNDKVDGGDGLDTLSFTTSGVNDGVTLSANGARTSLFRDVSGVTLDIGGVERIDVKTRAGADTLIVHDLSGSGTAQVNIDLALSSGAGDGAADTVTVNATISSDTITVTSGSGETIVGGLAAETRVTGAESSDTVRVAGGDGNDVVDMTNLSTMSGGPKVVLDGGAGYDTVSFGGSSGEGDTLSWLELSGQHFFIRGSTIVTPTLSGFERILLRGGVGNDTLSIASVSATLGVTLDGGAGADQLNGNAGADVLLGGDGNDFVVGNAGSDTALLGAGEDTFAWSLGDGNDTVEGGGGFDTLRFAGVSADERIDISANGERVRLVRDFTSVLMDVNDVERIDLATSGGADTVVVKDLSGTDVSQVNIGLGVNGAGDNTVDSVTVSATAGDDAVTFAGGGSELTISGLTAETRVTQVESTDILGVQGSDGNDSFDLSALVDIAHVTLAGGAGADTVIFRASSEANTGMTVFASNGEFQFSRSSGGGDFIVANLSEIEHILLAGSAGNDTISAPFTEVTGAQLTLEGGAGDDLIGGSGGADVLRGGDGNDHIGGKDGDDRIELGAGDDFVAWNSGNGSDTIEGGSGVDTLTFVGGSASQSIDLTASGERVRLSHDLTGATLDVNDVESIHLMAFDGTDTFVVQDLSGTEVSQVTIDGGDGDDLVIWDVAASGMIDGASGSDTLQFNGADTKENFTLTASGGQALFSHVQSGATAGVTGVESIAVDAAGGADTVTVGDLAGTGVARVDVHLAAGQSGDGAKDRVVINASSASPVLNVATLSGETIITGLGQAVYVTGADAALDVLQLTGTSMNDTFDLSGLQANLFNVSVTSGGGSDTVFGSGGNDLIAGGAGNDTLRGGEGDDTFRWSSGDGSDRVEGQEGVDEVLFTGSNASETFTVSADGERVQLLRNVGVVSMDVASVEHIELKALWGTDTIVVNDVGGTGLQQVRIDLGMSNGNGDGQADSVTVSGTDAGDTVLVTSVDTDIVVVSGLAAEVLVDNVESMDTLCIQTGAGDDFIDTSALLAGGAQIEIRGGDGCDTFAARAATILDFDAAMDQLDFRDIMGVQSIDWVLAHAHEADGNVVFDFGDQHVITLIGQTLDALDAGNFIL